MEAIPETIRADFLAGRGLELLMDPGSPKRAGEYFGLNHKDKGDLIVLAYILADVVFGRSERGRPSGDGDRLLRLGLHLYFLEKQAGRLSDTEAAKKLYELRKKEKWQSWQSLRKQLPAARRELEWWKTKWPFPVEEWGSLLLKSVPAEEWGPLLLKPDL
jgi:hypothetical protein